MRPNEAFDRGDFRESREHFCPDLLNKVPQGPSGATRAGKKVKKFPGGRRVRGAGVLGPPEHASKSTNINGA